MQYFERPLVSTVGRQYSTWLTTRIFNSVRIGCRALVLNVLFSHLTMSCCSCVFDVRINLASDNTSTSRSNTVILFDYNDCWSKVCGFVLCVTVSHQFKFVAVVMHAQNAR